MKKIIAREYAPQAVDFSIYFDDDGMTNAGGKNCACYIVPLDRRHCAGFNMEELKQIEQRAENIIDGFHDVSGKWTDGFFSFDTYKEAMEYYDIPYNATRCNRLKKWAKNADPADIDDIAEFLSITTGEVWTTRSFTGYFQGDECTVLYCISHYSDECINEIGNFWLGCGTEFEIEGVSGYYILDTVRWHEGPELAKQLADMYGCEPEELEIQIYDGEIRTPLYRTLVV